MKKLYTMLFAGTIGFFAHGQATKLVLIEAFSNASCPPCAANNPQMNTLLDNNTSKALSVKFQANFPGFDPMNQQNPTENNNRRNYYGVNAVPGVMVDGTVGPVNSASLSQMNIDNAYNPGTDVDISVSHTISNNFGDIDISVSVNNLGSAAITGNLVLHVALVEKEINFPEPPGTTNEKDFYNVMRKMYPNENGTAIVGGLQPGMPQSFTLNHSIPNYIYNYGELAVVVWVQDVSTKQVYNAAYSSPLPLPAGAVDAGVELTEVDAGLCDSDFDPEVILVNSGTETITEATVSYSLNGGAPVDFSFTGSLAPNANTTISFPTASLNSGTSNEIVYSVSNVNSGAFDFNTMNNSTPTQQIALLDPTALTNNFLEGFESTPNFELPTSMIFAGDIAGLFVLDQNAVTGLNWNLGGFGGSDKSLMVDFYTMQVGEEFEIISPKIDLTSTPGLYVSFNYANAQYETSDDYLAFEASRDCGETWETLWSASGADLATMPPSNNRFFPGQTTTANTPWRKVPLYMSTYSNDDEVVFRFHGISDWGNALWIDDINIGGATVSVEEFVEEGDINKKDAFDAKIFPNPAKDRFELTLSLPELHDVSIDIVNQLGQTVRSSQLGNLQGNVSREFSVDNLSAGMYHVFITVDGVRHVKKLTIQ
ncbi:MAG: T9SS type A sorting domain-containing protein [Cryomorphaceae bacterium]|nr:T9SS type A sorting domain-containing protein [Cryomorphaceae bacterium]